MNIPRHGRVLYVMGSGRYRKEVPTCVVRLLGLFGWWYRRKP